MNDKLHNVLLVLFIKHSDAVNINADNLNTFSENPPHLRMEVGRGIGAFLWTGPTISLSLAPFHPSPVPTEAWLIPDPARRGPTISTGLPAHLASAGRAGNQPPATGPEWRRRRPYYTLTIHT